MTCHSCRFTPSASASPSINHSPAPSNYHFLFLLSFFRSFFSIALSFSLFIFLSFLFSSPSSPIYFLIIENKLQKLWYLLAVVPPRFESRPSAYKVTDATSLTLIPVRPFQFEFRTACIEFNCPEENEIEEKT